MREKVYSMSNVKIYFCFRKFIFVTMAIASTICAQVPSTTFNCLGAYAKLQGINDPLFDSIDYNSSKDECIEIRQKFISEVRREIRAKISDAEILPKHRNCIYEKLTGSESFVNSLIKAAALEHSGLSDQIGRLKSAVETVLEFVKSSVVYCESKSSIIDQFDSLFDEAKKAARNVTDYEEEYCVKKYLIKNNLIDSMLYDIVPNPHNINVTGLNCEAMIKSSNDEIYEQLGFVYLEKSSLGNIDKVECALEKFREADYFDLMMKITALTTVDITSEQKNNERENFVEILSKISSNILAC